jgi:hypothetical protein
MRIVMTLLVRDEDDIVRSNIEYHLSQGVDHIVATDNGSVDGTVDILREYERAGCLRLIHESQDDFSQDIWVTRMARMACTEFAADWVLNNDADEFWWPLEGSLRTTLREVSSQFGIISVPRTNFPPAVREDRIFYERMILREKVSVNALGKPLPPKVLHRADPDVQVAMGNHAVNSTALAPMLSAAPILIFHFPLRTYSQFENKIRLGGSAYERNTRLGRGIGMTWRELYVLFQNGDLRQYYDSKLAAEDDPNTLRGLVRDARFRDYMRVLDQ